jgi:hypothetical protein
MNSEIIIPAAALIALAAAHIGEEAANGFRRFFNMEWFKGNANCPVGPNKGLYFDQIGLFLLLAGSAVFGAWRSPRLILIAVGIIAADLVQHAIFSISKGKYTPGVATSALYLLYVVYFFSREDGRRLLTPGWGGLVALAAGASFIVINYAFARWKVQTGRCKPVRI